MLTSLHTYIIFFHLIFVADDVFKRYNYFQYKYKPDFMV